MEKVIYHATAKNNIKNILNTGFRPSPINEKHWLGSGIYFFEDIYFAIEWGIIGVIKKKNTNWNTWNNKCGIIAVQIDTKKHEVLDLSSPLGYDLFLTLLNVIKKKYSEEEYESIQEKGYAHMIKILEEIEEKEKIKLLSQFDVIMGIYPKAINTKERKHKSDFLTCSQRQLCVKNSNCITNMSQVNTNNNEVKTVFNLIVRNRRNKNDK